MLRLFNFGYYMMSGKSTLICHCVEVSLPVGYEARYSPEGCGRRSTLGLLRSPRNDG